ncbi:scaffoldin [Anaeromyces robustus]|uniref:Scaffoldin n=1 Tax=Anaeromyces robustus TaxID=1754192 RepID=A0A1Y1VVB3_9FUNG|nr:scaffoldin [Anaeromyces robustus]|eukprot:ORX65229.1 scaffoldin [Anaeromyces robustus]
MRLKRILSSFIIGSVFLLTVKAASVLSENCTGKTIETTKKCSEENVVSYCINGLTIYAFVESNTDTASCQLSESLNDNTENIVKLDGVTLTHFTPTENGIDENNDLKKLFVISCSEGKCTRMEKNVVDSTGYTFKIAFDDENKNEKLDLEITIGSGESGSGSGESGSGSGESGSGSGESGSGSGESGSGSGESGSGSGESGSGSGESGSGSGESGSESGESGSGSGESGSGSGESGSGSGESGSGSGESGSGSGESGSGSGESGSGSGESGSGSGESGSGSGESGSGSGESGSGSGESGSGSGESGSGSGESGSGSGESGSESGESGSGSGESGSGSGESGSGSGESGSGSGESGSGSGESGSGSGESGSGSGESGSESGESGSGSGESGSGSGESGSGSGESGSGSGESGSGSGESGSGSGESGSGSGESGSGSGESGSGSGESGSGSGESGSGSGESGSGSGESGSGSGESGSGSGESGSGSGESGSGSGESGSGSGESGSGSGESGSGSGESGSGSGESGSGSGESGSGSGESGSGSGESGSGSGESGSGSGESGSGSGESGSGSGESGSGSGESGSGSGESGSGSGESSSGSGESDSGSGIPGYYLMKNGEKVTDVTTECKDKCKLHYCDEANDCVEVSTNVGYYLDGSTATNTSGRRTSTTTYSKLIYCNASKTCNSYTPAGIGYYINAGGTITDNKYGLIQCTTTSSCTEANNNAGYYISGADIDNNVYKKLIKCTDSNKCTAASAPVAPGYFLSGESYTSASPSYYTQLIKCSTTSSCAGPAEFDKVGYLLNSDGANATTYTKLIDCSTSKQCKELAPLVSNYVNAETGTAGTSTYTSIINCTSSACSNVPTPNDGFFLSRAENTNGSTVYGALIKCETVSNAKTCSEVSSPAEGAYLDGNNSANVITFDSNKKATSAAGETKPGYAYIDAATADTSDPTKYTNVIDCSSGTCISITHGNAVAAVTTGSNITPAQNTGFIDASKSTTNYIICSTTECKSYAFDNNRVAQGHAILDGSSKKDGKFKNILIYSNSKFESLAASSKLPNSIDGFAYIDNGSGDSTLFKYPNVVTADGLGYIDGTDITKMITCDSTDVQKDTYINAVDFSQVINCPENCTIYQTGAKAGRSEYFPRYVDGAAELLNCTLTSGKSNCTLVATTDQKFKVFINDFNDEDNYTENKPLITCDKNAFEDVATIYYPNSDNVNTEPLKNDLIKCVKEGEGTAAKVVLVKVVVWKPASNSTATVLEYFVNAGSTNTTVPLQDTLIECKSGECSVLEAKDGDIYIDTLNTAQTIQCTTVKGCVAVNSKATESKNEIFLNSSDLNGNSGSTDVALTGDLIVCSNNSTAKCEVKNGAVNEVYINSYNITEIIYCTSAGCKTRESKATTTQPEFFINADPINSSDEKLVNDLIRCKNTGSKINCEIVSAKDGDVYMNGNVDNDLTMPLIICTETNGCQTNGSLAASDKPPVYYVNSGSVLSTKLSDTLIQCQYGSSAATCTILPASLNDVYVNYGNNTETFPLIKCVKSGCKVSSSSATEDSNEYYLNAGDIDNNVLVNDIIECTNLKDVITCEELPKVRLGVYLNSNYAESGDNNQLIQCTNDNGCVGIKTGSSSSKIEYYVNAESVDQTNSIIYCSNKKCEKQTPETVPSYYVGINEDINGLIECTNSTGPCNLKSAFTSSGYFLNSGSNKAVNQTIICDSIDGCETVKVDLGYYVNVGDETKPIIKCDKEGSECVAEASKACPETEEAKAGNYCYEDGQLRFYPVSNSTYVTASKSDDYYTFATIPANGFPGIKSETNSLFKVSYAYINRFYQGGVVMIDKNGKLVDSLSSDQNDVTLYDCNDSTKMCTEKPGCTHNTYMYDSENKKAVFCNNGILEYASFTGYVVDGNRVSGSNHPYIIQCASNGKCVSFKPKVASYFENSGYDSAINSLIQCQSNNCSTVTAEVGYYVGHEGSGYIKCTSATACTYYPSKSKVKYVNAGSNKSSYAIISCTKNGGCSAAKAKTGFYLTYVSTLLIHCSSSSTCVEYTPTVNYYANADSSENNKSIINCVQNSQVVTCAAEATGDGYYPTSTPNVLIRCKSDTDCKTIVVVTGIFRAAITTSDNSSGGMTRRIDGDDEEGAVNDNNSEDENSVNLSRSSDDAYGIIRCVNGKCQSLSPSEVAAIPICEFNNNKCYITNEYAMTKSATTSISAGNICTNLDRSVFYFATDTVVVKPNVISGVTATYIYTTTNSNCLEVNDSYTGMYFTVGSNIYTLDQGCVNQFYETGYYFINTAKNTLVTGNDIDSYNDENVKLYRCNGSSCSIVDKPESMTYYADINKRILRYNVNSGAYSFAYEKDIVCAFANNKCTPNADLKNQEFCITYKGELVLAKADIKNRETGECYRAPSITSTIYGYSQYLYNMNMFAAQMVDETGYYIVSLSTNTTVVSKNYKTKNNGLVVYGCQLSSCKEYTPEEDVYYYDGRAKTILRHRDGIWNTPSNSGYAYISINPADTYIYRFTKNVDEIKINSIANYGYYYTVDQEMYHCNEDEGSSCTPIKDTGYYFTNTGEVYYCVHDSEGLETTECTKQACVSGQYYYIEDAYYRCESSSTLVPVMSRYCSYNENVIVNFPLALTEEYPDKIKQAMEGIEKNNNSTAIVRRRGKSYLESISGIFTNCTYNVEETKSTFDLVCVNNYVKVDEDTDDIKICSMEQLGYVECVEDEENPEKCNVSAAYMLVKPTLFTILILFVSSLYYLLF